MEVHHISPDWLEIDRVAQIIDNDMKLALSEESARRIARCREYLDNKMATQKEPIYGVSTGFGSLCNISIDPDQLATLQKNLVMSHSCSIGEKVDPEIVRLMMLLKVQSLSYGHSGVQTATVERLIEMFNRHITPVVRRLGSLGASGDLAPLANLSLPLLGLGEVDYDGQTISGAELLRRTGWEPITLQSKEGLALLNGTQFMSAHGVWAIIRARRIMVWADKIGALSLDAFDGRIEPFLPQIQAVRPHPGQKLTADAVRYFLEGSELQKQPKSHVQDPTPSAAYRRFTVPRKILSNLPHARWRRKSTP